MNIEKVKLKDYLKQQREEVPSWLKGFKSGDSFSRNDFFSSRVVYYPGSGEDGHPVKLFATAHFAHCFVYVDYGLSQARLESALEDPLNKFLGYKTISRIQISENNLVPAGWVPHVEMHEVNRFRNRLGRVAESPFCFLEILEREEGRDEDHGPARLAILFLGADGIASYDALFCQNTSEGPPFLLVLQDHGFSGNYSPFGKGGLLEKIAKRSQTFPSWLLVGNNTKPWDGFGEVQGAEGDQVDGQGRVRFLYKRQEV